MYIINYYVYFFIDMNIILSFRNDNFVNQHSDIYFVLFIDIYADRCFDNVSLSPRIGCCSLTLPYYG